MNYSFKNEYTGEIIITEGKLDSVLLSRHHFFILFTLISVSELRE